MIDGSLGGSGGTVTSDQWQQIKAVLADALEREGAEREDFLAQACQGDDELRQEVESLLASEAEVGNFIETPAFQILQDEAELAGGATPLPGKRAAPRPELCDPEKSG